MKTKFIAFLRFLTTRVFLLNLLVAALVSFGIFYFTMRYVRSYANHGDEYSVRVGWYYNMNIEDAKREIKKLGLIAQVDSVYVPGKEPGTVIKQEPYPSDSGGFKVKPGRTINLKVQSILPPSRQIPDFDGKAVRIVVAKMYSRGLKTKITYVPNEHDYVVGATWNGKQLKEGMKVPFGSTITLLAGRGQPQAVEVPDLTGMTISKATLRLSNASLRLFVTDCDGCMTREDSASAVVIRQSPGGGPNSFASAGGEVTVWMSLSGMEEEESPDEY